MPGPHGGILRTLGDCAYCERRTEASCRVCGRAICPDHAIEGELVCLDCGTAPVDD